MRKQLSGMPSLGFAAALTGGLSFIATFPANYMLSCTAIINISLMIVIKALRDDGSQTALLRTLVHESLYHLRMDAAAERYHNKALAALAMTGNSDNG